MRDRWKKPGCQKTSSIRPVVSIQHRHMTDRRTDGHTHAYTALARLASRGKNITASETDIFDGDSGTCGWRHNYKVTVQSLVCDGDAAFCQITLDTFYSLCQQADRQWRSKVSGSLCRASMVGPFDFKPKKNKTLLLTTYQIKQPI